MRGMNQCKSVEMHGARGVNVSWLMSNLQVPETYPRSESVEIMANAEDPSEQIPKYGTILNCELSGERVCITTPSGELRG